MGQRDSNGTKWQEFCPDFLHNSTVNGGANKSLFKRLTIISYEPINQPN